MDLPSRPAQPTLAHASTDSHGHVTHVQLSAEWKSSDGLNPILCACGAAFADWARHAAGDAVQPTTGSVPDWSRSMVKFRRVLRADSEHRAVEHITIEHPGGRLRCVVTTTGFLINLWAQESWLRQQRPPSLERHLNQLLELVPIELAEHHQAIS